MIYFIKEDGTKNVKIGYTDAVVEVRLQTLQTANPRELVVLRTIEGMQMEEFFVHNVYAEYRVSGEWFTFQPSMLTDSLDDMISKLKPEDMGQRSGIYLKLYRFLNASNGFVDMYPKGFAYYMDGRMRNMVDAHNIAKFGSRSRSGYELLKEREKRFEVDATFCN